MAKKFYNSSLKKKKFFFLQLKKSTMPHPTSATDKQLFKFPIQFDSKFDNFPPHNCSIKKIVSEIQMHLNPLL